MSDMPLTDALSLSTAAGNGKAREQAMQQGLARLKVEPTSLIDFHSAGRLLILGQGEAALQAADRLEGQLAITVLLPPDDRSGESDERVARARLDSLNGYLGHFEAEVEREGKVFPLAKLMAGTDYFDLILDLNPLSVLPHETPPLGYYATGGDKASLEAALEELPSLIGEFEKPKFFNYDPAICAHGRMGKQGCSRCIDACPTLAITSLGEQVEVNPNLCQGGGTCVTVCPSGAMSYAYPSVNDLLTGLRETLSSYRQQGGTEPRLLFYGGESYVDPVQEAAAHLPGNLFPVELEEIGSLGMDGWLTALAYGADQVVLFVPPGLPLSVRQSLNEQTRIARALLRGMGHDEERLQVIAANDADGLLAGLQDSKSFDSLPAAEFLLANNKRQRIRDAVGHLHDQLDTAPVRSELPQGSPFGQVNVDASSCTLCFACVAICPAKALHAGNDAPKLHFTEANCLQCGLCENACPESAISLASSYLYDDETATHQQLLHEEEPFHCISCGKAFATAKMMEAMSSRLADHWMFQDETARRRLQMCDECRVVDMFEKDGGFQQHRRPM